jgi:hypothetical protein
MIDLRLGDCLAGMATLEDKSVGVTLCDPPYAKVVVTSSKRAVRRSMAAREASGIRTLATTRDLGYEGISDGDRTQMACQIARITQRWALVFCDAESIGAWRVALEKGGLRHVRVGAWVMPNYTPQFTGDRPGTGWEACEIAHSTERMRWNGRGRAAAWVVCRPLNGTAEREALAHPTPKPLDLFLSLVSDFTDPGELVCDPFAGSGTTAVACKRLGRSFIGWEKDAKFHAAALKRIEAAREQFQLPRFPKAKQQRLLP